MSVTSATYTVDTNGKKPYVQSTKRVSPHLVEEIMKALKTVSGFGSIEIYVQDHQVTQITVRSITKTRHVLAE